METCASVSSLQKPSQLEKKLILITGWRDMGKFSATSYPFIFYSSKESRSSSYSLSLQTLDEILKLVGKIIYRTFYYYKHLIKCTDGDVVSVLVASLRNVTVGRRPAEAGWVRHLKRRLRRRKKRRRRNFSPRTREGKMTRRTTMMRLVYL